MKIKRFIAFLLAFILIAGSMPLSALAMYYEHAVHYVGTDNKYKINYRQDFVGIKDNIFWEYTYDTHTLYLNTTNANGTIGKYTREKGNSSTEPGIIPTYFTAINVNTDLNDEVIEGYKQQLRDNGWSEERIEALYGPGGSLAYTTDENGVNYYGSSEEYYWMGQVYVEHVIIGKDVKEIKQLRLGSYLPNLQSVTFEEGSVIETIGNYFLYNAQGVTSITLPDSLKTIGKYFMEYTGITEIDLSNTDITVIPEDAFSCCTALTTAVLNSNTTEIGLGAFSGSGISSIELPNSLRTIGAAAFANTANLYEIQLPNYIQQIDNLAFSDSAIRSIDLTNNNVIRTIGSEAFSNTKNLKTAALPTRYFETIPEKAFRNSALEEISMPCVKYINSYAFENTNLKSITIPSNCEKINKYAFYNSKQLATVHIASTNLKFVGANPFEGCALKDFTMVQKSDFADENEIEVLQNSNFLKEKDLKTYGYTGSQLETYCSDNNITFIDLDDVAEEQGGEVTPERYELNKKRGTWAHGTFYVDSNILVIEGEGKMLSNIITDRNGRQYTVAEYLNEYDLHRIDIKDGVKRIPNNFLYVDEDTSVTLKYVYLPFDLESIGENAFRNVHCSQYITQSYAVYSRAYGDNLFEAANVSILPEHIKSIGSYAFANTEMIDGISMMMPSDLEELSEGVFRGSDISSVAFERSSLKKVDKYALYDCPNLSILYVSNTATDIFENEENIKENAFGILFDGTVNENLTVYTSENSAADIYCKKYGISTEYEETPSLSGTMTTTATTNTLTWKYYNNMNRVELSFNHNKKPIFETPSYHNRANKETVETYYSFTTKTREEESAVTSESNLYNGLGSFFSQVNNPYSQYNENLEEHALSVDTLTVTGEKLHMLKVSNLFSPFNPKEVILPDSIKYLDYNVFGNCTRLETVTLPDSVLEIGTKVFYNCPSLQYVGLGNGITEIPSKIFYNTKSLRFVDIGTGVTKINTKAFSDCTALEEIVIPDNVTTIESEAFYNCINAQHIDIGSGVTTLGENAFTNSVYCEEVNVNSDNINTDNFENAFKDVGIYTDGVTVNFGDNVTKIDMKLLSGLNVKTINIGENVTEIINLQYAPETLANINVNSGNTAFTVNNGCLYNGSTLVLAPKTAKTVTISSTANAIGDYAFYESSVNAVSIPASVKTIGRYAFANVRVLKTVSLGKGVRTIGESAFENDTQLRLAYFPENVISVGDCAYKNCTNLASVTFVFDGISLKTIGNEAFYGCTSIAGIVIPESVETIGDRAFESNTSLRYAYIWGAEIGTDAFAYDDELTIYTMAGSDAYRYAREENIEYAAYTDENAFMDECVIKIDELAGYVGYCDNGHGNIQYLTVYEADCENDGYIIGVCEFCSEILEEIHQPALGHDMHETINIPATEMTKGFKVEKCSHCGESFCTYEDALGENVEIEEHKVCGKVTVAQNSSAAATNYPLRDVKVVIDGLVVATTDDNGLFSINLETGVYEAQLRYAYGINRKIYIIVEDEDIYLTEPVALIACDFNKDGVINNDDMALFRMVISSSYDDVSYLRFVDLNNDGFINGKDQSYIKGCIGINASEYSYPNVIISK